MLIITAIVLLVSLGAVLMWNEGGVTKTVTIGQTQSEIFETFSIGQIINNYIIDSFQDVMQCTQQLKLGRTGLCQHHQK